jgi:hypothetical protein
MNNNKGHSETYREVLHEDPIHIRWTNSFFDYISRIGGVRKFIAGTRKPAVRIKVDADSILPLRKYAWNAKLPLLILTNFDEFAIYNRTTKPENGANVAKERIRYLTYKEILEEWDYRPSIFSQERPGPRQNPSDLLTHFPFHQVLYRKEDYQRDDPEIYDRTQVFPDEEFQGTDLEHCRLPAA